MKKFQFSYFIYKNIEQVNNSTNTQQSMYKKKISQASNTCSMFQQCNVNFTPEPKLHLQQRGMCAVTRLRVALRS